MVVSVIEGEACADSCKAEFNFDLLAAVLHLQASDKEGKGLQ